MEIDLASTRLFRGLSPADIDQLLADLTVRVRTYEKGEVILLEGDPTSCLFLVRSGSAVIELSDAWGTVSVLAHVGPGETFAEAYACIPGERSLVTVSAVERSEVLALDVGQLLDDDSDAMPARMAVVHNLLALCARKNLHLSQRMLHIQPKTIRGRLMAYFSDCAKRAGSAAFDIPYNRQQLANYLNVERTALCHELSNMQREGLLRCRKEHMELTEGGT